VRCGSVEGGQVNITEEDMVAVIRAIERRKAAIA
jgi:hypothetical protein